MFFFSLHNIPRTRCRLRRNGAKRDEPKIMTGRDGLVVCLLALLLASPLSLPPSNAFDALARSDERDAESAREKRAMSSEKESERERERQNECCGPFGMNRSPRDECARSRFGFSHRRGEFDKGQERESEHELERETVRLGHAIMGRNGNKWTKLNKPCGFTRRE